MTNMNEEKNKKLFENMVFFISREVYKEVFEFCIKSFSGVILYDSDNFESEAYRSNVITHVIIDRPLEEEYRIINRNYV